ncbi:HCL357Cp [Eremothecium sinecaudum]|uniref:Pre-mRNA-splicing factor CWC2 n=1 Tax=Eremothecium sinecaudum TaxID=45286 RepID=A0A109UYD2_9SACH|nr:HCL357Cp [Eremothecium sinecaudum]AMD19794.1 HCL357Cp [Eremothecium sinecaudum]
MDNGDEKEQPSWKSRSAKIQVREVDLPSSIPPQTGLAFNIWYNKWSQGGSNNARFVNPYRLEPEYHSGLTEGDRIGEKFFCIYFSKGMCCLGKKCKYLHHVPEEEDIARLTTKSAVLDCFGREKFADYREDMGGVGTFNKQNRTLYIGGILGSLNNKMLKAAQIESRIRFVFNKLGMIDRIRYVENKNCAFVKFKHQVSAEFAKESMSNQTLLIPSDKDWDQRKEGTGLLVKWANEDPNPAAKKMEEQEQKETAMQLMVKLLEDHERNKKRKLEEESKLSSKVQPGNIISGELIQQLRKRNKTVATSKHSDHPQRLTETAVSLKGSLVSYSSSEEE